MEHAILLSKRLVGDESEDQKGADGERGRGVRVRPGERVLRPRQTDTEKHNSGCQEEVADPVELLELLAKRKGRLALGGGRIVDGEAEGGGEDVEPRGDVPKVAEALGGDVGGAHKGAAHQHADDATEGVGDAVGGLAVRAVLAGEDLGRHGVEQGLGAVAQGGDGEAGDGHGHRGRPRHDDGADAAEEGRDDEEPAAAPVVGGLGEDGAEDGGADGDGRGDPYRVLAVAEGEGDCVGELEKGSVVGILRDMRPALSTQHTAPAPTTL